MRNNNSTLLFYDLLITVINCRFTIEINREIIISRKVISRSFMYKIPPEVLTPILTQFNKWDHRHLFDDQFFSLFYLQQILFNFFKFRFSKEKLSELVQKERFQNLRIANKAFRLLFWLWPTKENYEGPDQECKADHQVVNSTFRMYFTINQNSTFRCIVSARMTENER